MVLEINYTKRKETISQHLNVEFKNDNLRMYFKILKKDLRKIKYINSVYLFHNAKNSENYSIDDSKVINEVLLFLSNVHFEFSLVIKQVDGNKKITIHYSYGSYSHTEISIGDMTYTSYLPIDESIQFAEQLFNKVIE